MKQHPPLTITAFYDTRAGHSKQTRGLVQALQAFTPVQTHEIFLPDYNLFRILLDWLKFMVIFLPKDKSARTASDLILGTGTHTHIPMLLHRRRNNGRAITCMTPGWPLAKYMDLCFIPEHDTPPASDRIVSTVGPPNTAVNKNIHDPAQGLILIGGKDKKTHHWHNEKMIGQVRRIIEKQPHMSWTLSTSPRTPLEIEQMLTDLAGDVPGISIVPFKETGPSWIENQYAAADVVWVSADSVSMVYEALTAGCRVGILSVDWKKKGHRLARAIDLLEKNRKIVSFESFMQKNVYPEHSHLNEARRCAEEILRRWWPKRLQ